MPPAGDDYEPTMGAVQLLVHRRLRTVQKRVAKIAKAEEKRSAGGEIDDQQKELIDGKPLTMALLEEFTKLSQEVEKAVEEDRLAVLREERAKVAAKAERSAARRAAAAGDRPDEATKADEASAAPPVPPVDGGATRTTGKKPGRRGGGRESPADGCGAARPRPLASTPNQPPPAEIPQVVDAPPPSRGESAAAAARTDDARATSATPTPGRRPPRDPARDPADPGGVFQDTGKQGPFQQGPGAPVATVDGVSLRFGKPRRERPTLGTSRGTPDGSVATEEERRGDQRRPPSSTLPPPVPVEMTPAEINPADYGRRRVRRPGRPRGRQRLSHVARTSPHALTTSAGR